MKTLVVSILAALICISSIVIVEASTVIFEAGPFAVIMDKDMEIMDIGGAEAWNTIGFEPIISRELVKDNYYNIKIGTVLAKGESGLVSEYPTVIEISEKPIDDTFLFTPEAVKEITVGQLNPVKTTLFTGKTANDLTPYFVNFTLDEIYCTVYEPNSSETSMTDFLKAFSVIRKKDLGKYDLSKLWSES